MILVLGRRLELLKNGLEFYSMKNNGSTKDDDDFWKILSESDEEIDGEIGLLLKPKTEEGMQRPKGLETCQSAGTSRECTEEMSQGFEQGPRQQADDFEGCDGEEKTSNRAIEDGPLKPVDEEEEILSAHMAGDNRSVCSGGHSVQTGSGQDGTSALLGTGAVPKTSSVDEMDFMWDDDEEFIVGGVSNMSIGRETPDETRIDQEGPQDADSLGDAVCVAPENTMKEEEVSELGDNLGELNNEGFVASVAAKPQDARVDITRPRPLAKFICGSLITVFMSSQKRFNMQGQAMESKVNMVQWYKLDYSFPDIRPSNFVAGVQSDGDSEYVHVYELAQLKKPSIDSISRIVSSTRATYCSKDIHRVVSAESMNRLIELCFEDADKAFEYAIEKEIWEFGILSPARAREVGDKFLERFCNSPHGQLASCALGFSSRPFRVDGDWREYLREVLSTKNAIVCDDFIRHAFDTSVPDGLFVAMSCHLLGIVDISRYLWMFSRNFEALRVLCYVEHEGSSIKDLDLLKYEFVSAGTEFDRARAEEYFKASRKHFRKELVASLESVFDTKWSFGLKSVFDFGIKKILNVESLEEDNPKTEGFCVTKGPTQESNVEKKPDSGCLSNGPSFHYKGNAGSVVVESRKTSECDESLQGEKGSVANKASSVERSLQSCKDDGMDEGQTRNEDTKIGKLYNLPERESLLKHDEKKPQIEAKQASIDSASYGGGEQSNLYMDARQSKSFADFFATGKEPETGGSDDTSLFLSKFADDDMAVQEKSEKIAKKGGSFFGFLNMFRKEPVHKANLDVDDDFRYDPVEKKWVGGVSSGGKGGEGPILKPRSIPKPDIGTRRAPKDDLGTDVTSMYANRKSVGGKGIPGVLGKKE